MGFAEEVDRVLHLLKRHLPYHESDHVLNIAYNVLVGGTCLEDIELQRQNEAWLEAVGAAIIPDPTTEGDFLRLTLKMCGPILGNNPYIDEVLFYSPETVLELLRGPYVIVERSDDGQWLLCSARCPRGRGCSQATGASQS